MTLFETAAHAAISNRDAEATREDYERALKRWLTFCSERKENPANPPDGLAAAFRTHLKKNGWLKKSLAKRKKKSLANESVRTMMAALSAIYRTILAQRKPAATWNPFDPDAVKWPPSAKSGKTEKLLATDFDKVLAACAEDTTWRGARDAAIIRLLHTTGLRRMSAANLKRERIFLQGDGSMDARVQSKGSGGDELDRIVIPKVAADALLRWIEIAPASTYVFPSRDTHSHIDVATINRIFTKRGDAADVVHAHPHRLRATFATDAISAGTPIRDVQEALLHKDVRSTIRYDKGLRGANVAEAVERFRKKGDSN